jgi:methylenetetrahydrofolate dehydrogenase (NADP+)/methenyltetrahydrofolate cyclohydrolase
MSPRLSAVGVANPPRCELNARRSLEWRAGGPDARRRLAEGSAVSPSVIDGNAIAEELRAEVSDELHEVRAAGARPGLATILVGDDEAARAYERHVHRLAERLECRYVCEHLPAAAATEDVLAVLGKLNADPRITGILLLRPLPAHIPEARIYATLDPLKDVEVVHPMNAGLLALGRPRYVPSTPASCFYLLDHYLRSSGRDPETYYAGKTLDVVGRSDSVGKPAAALGLLRHATVVICHSRTSEAGRLADYTGAADIIIAAAGVAGLVTGDMVRDGVIAIDVGMNPVHDESAGKVRFVGDVDFEGVARKAEAISPVPGGVGPITDVWLVRNTVAAAAIAARLDPVTHKQR